MGTIQTIVSGVAPVLGVAIICVAGVYGCVNNNRQYYAAFNQCVASGGTVVPTSNNGASTIVCVKK